MLHVAACALAGTVVFACAPSTDRSGAGPVGKQRFEGRHYRGAGDTGYLELLETARRFFEPDPELQNMAMLYTPDWNGLVEGPTWHAWWIQNSYGTTYNALPFYREPFLTFLQNSQDLWFDQIGDGVREGMFGWVAPDGSLCDAAGPGWVIYKQGDGRTDIHDWGMEFTAAGLLMQAELLLIDRQPDNIARYLPRLERCADFLETRRDAHNGLFLAGPAGNLLAPSYAGWAKPDGTYGHAYLAGLSVTTIAALDRLIELELLLGRTVEAEKYAERRRLAKEALPLLMTEDGYLIRSLDPDGTRHGVFGAEEHGYFEASPNHDAIAFRVVDDAQAQAIYRMIASIPELRPYDFVLPNYPSYDDLYTAPEGLWAYGTWVNGGHWSTCEGRMVLAYYRLRQFEDARRSMQRLMTFARRFRMDNPLTERGNSVYQPGEPINICYDTFAPAAAFIRGLFEYLYTAEGVRLVPHIPPGVTELEQLDPIRFGRKLLYIATTGAGPVTGVEVNGRPWHRFDNESVFLPYALTPDEARVVIQLGGAKPAVAAPAERRTPRRPPTRPAPVDESDLTGYRERVARLQRFASLLSEAGLGDTYEAAHARLAVAYLGTVIERRRLQAAGAIEPLPEERSQVAADRSYVDTLGRLCSGIETLLDACKGRKDARGRRLAELWAEAL